MAISLVGPLSSGPAVGGAGVATANQDSTHPIIGVVVGIYLKYVGSPPATTDVTVRTKGSSGPSFTLLKVDNAAVDKLFTVKQLDSSPAGVAFTDSYSLLPVHDVLNILIEGADADDSVDVYLFVDRG